MSKLGSYCKAIPLAALRAYPDWRERPGVSVPGTAEEGLAATDQDAFLYLQEDYTVTAGIFLGEAVVFDAVTQEWRDYCRDTLRFEPDHAD